MRWYEPKSINGIIVCYIVQRIKGSASTPTNMVKLKASFWNTYHDGTVVPHTFYRYRIVAYTSVGGTPSPYNTITTPQARKSINEVTFLVQSKKNIFLKLYIEVW